MAIIGMHGVVEELSGPAMLEPSEPVFLPRERKLVVGWDVGQQMDPSAIAIVQFARGVIDRNTPLQRHTGCGLIPQEPAEFFDVRYLRRLPLGTSYPTQVDMVKSLMARAPLAGDAKNKPATLVIDQTGCGAAVGDLIAETLQIRRVTITSGQETTNVGPNRWNVAKQTLVSCIDALLSAGRLRIASALSESEQMKSELLTFRRTLSAVGRASYNAAEGKHDDLLIATSLACWWASRKTENVAAFGRY